MMISFSLFKLNQATDHEKRRESRRRSVFEDGESEVQQARSIDEATDLGILECVFAGPKSEAAIETDPAVIETVDQSPKSLLSPGLGPPRIVRRLPAAEGYVFGRRAARILKLLDRLLHLPGLCICF